MKSKKTLTSILLWVLGMLLSVGAPLTATLSFFPVWVAQGGEFVISGFTVLIAIICALPIYRWIKSELASPSGVTIWLVLFLTFFALSRVADEMRVIAFVGFIGNILGGIAFRIRKQLKEEKSDE